MSHDEVKYSGLPSLWYDYDASRGRKAGLTRFVSSGLSQSHDVQEVSLICMCVCSTPTCSLCQVNQANFRALNRFQGTGIAQSVQWLGYGLEGTGFEIVYLKEVFCSSRIRRDRLRCTPSFLFIWCLDCFPVVKRTSASSWPLLNFSIGFRKILKYKKGHGVA
jgi:hypothetical protein